MSTRPIDGVKHIDGVVKDWGDRLDYGRVRARKGRRTIAGNRHHRGPAPVKRTNARDKLLATVRKVPEVMVKISGGGKDLRSIKAHLDYVTRNGAIELEDEQGQVHQGKEEVRGVRDDWRGSVIPHENGTRREAFNIVLSMPPGTDRAAVKNAARAFAAELFSNHQYVFAAHDDEKHPHVHLVVKAVDKEGVRLNPRKADLQHWRETFAEKLREQGIQANATPRRARGIVKRPEKQAVFHLNQEHAKGKRAAPARVTAAQHQAAELEARTGQKHVNPAEQKIATRRAQVQHDFGTVARALATGTDDDKRLALEIVRFVQQMPPLRTRHAEQVDALRRAGGAAGQHVERQQPEKKIDGPERGGSGSQKDRDRQ